jgi:hypothetical protein
MTLKALVFMYLEDKDYEISETLGISEVNASEDE